MRVIVPKRSVAPLARQQLGEALAKLVRVPARLGVGTALPDQNPLTPIQLVHAHHLLLHRVRRRPVARRQSVAKVEGAVAIGPHVVIAPFAVAVDDRAHDLARAQIAHEPRHEHGVAPLVNVGHATDRVERVVRGVKGGLDDPIHDVLVQVEFGIEARRRHQHLEYVDEDEVDTALDVGLVEEAGEGFPPDEQRPTRFHPQPFVRTALSSERIRRVRRTRSCVGHGGLQLLEYPVESGAGGVNFPNRQQWGFLRTTEGELDRRLWNSLL